MSEYYKLKGHLKIQSFDSSGNLTSEYEDSNLVMDLQRESMALLQGQVTGSEPINSLRLGTRGVHGTSYGENIMPGSSGYHPEMSHLFQENTSSVDGGYVFVQKFDVQGSPSETFQSTSEKMLKFGSNVSQYNSQGQEMTRSVNGRVITFEVTLPRGSQNSPGQGGDPQYLPYSEQQLYCGDRIFSMKTFPQKFKDSDQKIVLTWSIIF